MTGQCLSLYYDDYLICVWDSINCTIGLYQLSRSISQPISTPNYQTHNDTHNLSMTSKGTQATSGLPHLSSRLKSNSYSRLPARSSLQGHGSRSATPNTLSSSLRANLSPRQSGSPLIAVTMGGKDSLRSQMQRSFSDGDQKQFDRSMGSFADVLTSTMLNTDFAATSRGRLSMGSTGRLSMGSTMGASLSSGGMSLLDLTVDSNTSHNSLLHEISVRDDSPRCGLDDTGRYVDNAAECEGYVSGISSGKDMAAQYSLDLVCSVVVDELVSSAALPVTCAFAGGFHHTLGGLLLDIFQQGTGQIIRYSVRKSDVNSSAVCSDGVSSPRVNTLYLLSRVSLGMSASTGVSGVVHLSVPLVPTHSQPSLSVPLTVMVHVASQDKEVVTSVVAGCCTVLEAWTRSSPLPSTSDLLLWSVSCNDCCYLSRSSSKDSWTVRAAQPLLTHATHASNALCQDVVASICWLFDSHEELRELSVTAETVLVAVTEVAVDHGATVAVESLLMVCFGLHSSLSFVYCPALNCRTFAIILFDMLHALYECYRGQEGACRNKLSSTISKAVLLRDALARFCQHISGEVSGCYATHYKQWPEVTAIGCENNDQVRNDIDLSFTSCKTVPHLNDWLTNCLHAWSSTSCFTFDVCPFQHIAQIKLHKCQTVNPFGTIVLTSRIFDHLKKSRDDVEVSKNASRPFQVVADAFLLASDGNLECLESLPHWLRLIVCVSLRQCQANPGNAWPEAVLNFIGREDLAVGTSHVLHVGPLRHHDNAAMTGRVVSAKPVNSQCEDGLWEVELTASARFCNDDRVHEICRLLRSSRPAYLRVDKSPEVSDLDHRVKLQQRLLLLVRRMLGVTVGRGMLTMNSLEPLLVEPLVVPPLSLSGRVQPSNSIIQLDASATTADMTHWPKFHNGVVTALRIGSSADSSQFHCRKVTRNWILYNKTTAAAVSDEISHAGVLLGLGLLGHLKVLTVADICDYLTQGQEYTSAAVLIGTAASKIGTADALLSKTLCLHLPPLLPQRYSDIEIPAAVQGAAVAGLGLLHCGTGNRLMTEFLLAEMYRKSPSDRCDLREALALTTGWALGMILMTTNSPVSSLTSISPVKHTDEMNSVLNDKLSGLSDLRVEERLFRLIDGGSRGERSHLFEFTEGSNDGNSKCSRILEGDNVNMNVTCPGAIIALALIHLKSRSSIILGRLAIPLTAFALDSVPPDLLMFRALGLSLIMWSDVLPTVAWIDAQIPSVVMLSINGKTSDEKVDHLGQGLQSSSSAPMLDKEVALAVYLSLLSGFCHGMGLVYAGTGDDRAMATILEKLKILQCLRDNKPSGLKHKGAVSKSLRPVLEMSTAVVSIALACVAAGTGDVVCMRTLRELRWRVDDVTYGTHMALGMAQGLLFLAGGRASLKRDSVSVACLLMATIPRFPSRSIDQQYHLQPLRHLYVAAVEQRVLHCTDVDSGLSVPAAVKISMTDGREVHAVAPCLLPELSLIDSLHMTGDTATAGLHYHSRTIRMHLLREQGQGQRQGQGQGKNHLFTAACAQGMPEVFVKRRSTKCAQDTSAAATPHALALLDLLSHTHHLEQQSLHDALCSNSLFADIICNAMEE